MAHGLCDDCFWKNQCYFEVEHPNEDVRRCDDDCGLFYMPVKKNNIVE